MAELTIKTQDPQEIRLLTNRNEMFRVLESLTKVLRGKVRSREVAVVVSRARSLVNEIKRAV